MLCVPMRGKKIAKVIFNTCALYKNFNLGLCELTFFERVYMNQNNAIGAFKNIRTDDCHQNELYCLWSKKSPFVNLSDPTGFAKPVTSRKKVFVFLPLSDRGSYRLQERLDR